MDDPVTTGTLTVEPEFSEGFEEMVRAIVRDEIKKVVTEKVDGVLKGIFTAVAKTAVSSMPKPQAKVDNSIHVASPRRSS